MQPGPSLELPHLTDNVTPGYEALDAELYILRYPASSGLPTIYLAIERPPVELGEVGTYEELARRSMGDGLDIDHIPSRKALELYQRSINPRIRSDELKRHLKRGAAVAIPKEVHQKLSETYGGRNTKSKSAIDGANLEMAVNNNLSAIRPGLIEHGISDEKMNAISESLHEINRKGGLYK